MLIFIFCLLAPVQITPFLRISFSTKNNNKSAMKQSNHILVEEKINFLSLAWLGIKKRRDRCESGQEHHLPPQADSAIKRMWVMDMTQQYCFPLAQYMTRMLKAVIDNKGQMTKYQKCC
jgi:hypothetical protein